MTSNFLKYYILFILIFGILIISILYPLKKFTGFTSDIHIKIISNCGNDKNCKINFMESLMQLSNDSDIECKIPNLPIYNPEIMKFYSNEDKPLNCSRTEDWIQCVKSFCFIKESIKLKQGIINCTYADIYRKNEYTSMLGPTKVTNGNCTLKLSDFVQVNCRSSNNGSWSGFGVGIRSKSRFRVRIRSKHKSKRLYNVLIFGFDSLSRNAVIRSLPKTYEYLTETLQANILKGYNIIGDGTAQALTPMFTGHTDLELPDTRKRISGSKYVDIYPLIWKDFEKFGYVTSYNEDDTMWGTFQMRSNGFERQPVDHYLRTLCIKYENSYCIGNNTAHKVMLNYVKNIMVNYENIAPHFTFTFNSVLSHNFMSLVTLADEDVYQWLVDLSDQNLLDNTILIFMTDHGNKFVAVRNTLQGKQEERLPFFSFTFPKSFKRQHPKAFKNFQQNLNLLTTPFDIHETLLDLLRLQNLNITTPLNKHQQKTPPRGISLFQVIPKNRSCLMAYIDPYWCTCLKWHNLNTTDKFIGKVAAEVVYAINNYTNYFRNICASLTLLTVNWALKLIPNKQLIHYTRSWDDDGFLTKNIDKPSGIIEVDMYQVQITVLPGNSIFEAAVEYNPSNNKFTVQMSQISRINKYEGQANCIYNLNPDLRKYCYCK